MYRKFPGIVNRTLEGAENPQAARYRVGLLHPEFREQADRIDELVVNHFSGHEAVIGWQIDNEVGSDNDCFCPVCIDQFREHLRKKFGSVENLNEAWGEHFWSLHFNSFDEVPGPGGGNFQLELEYRRFMSETNAGFARGRYDMIHRLDPGKWITTNCQSFWCRHTDWQKMRDTVDVPGMNHYPPRSPQLVIDLYRGRTGKLIALEQFTRLQSVDAGPGMMRLWAWMTIAHGAAGINFFRWRQCRWGQEQFADGILPHSGKENRLYRELVRMGGEIGSVGHIIDKTAVVAETAILCSYDSKWSVTCSKFPDLDPFIEKAAYHEALHRLNISTDAVSPWDSLDGYRLVIAPRLWNISQETAERLRDFVSRGGTLVLTAGSGVTDVFGKSFDTPRPGPLAGIAGIEVPDIAHEPGKFFTVESSRIPGISGSRGSSVWDEIELHGAEAAAVYSSGWRKGMPAVTVNKFGDGRVIYAGTCISGKPLESLVRWVIREAGVQQPAETPEGVQVHERRGEELTLRFLLNFTEESKAVQMEDGWQDAFNEETVSQVKVEPLDIRLLKRD
jgi:beta-galactosidase